MWCFGLSPAAAFGLQGLRELHSKRILHRDLKAQNIFLDEVLLLQSGSGQRTQTLSNLLSFPHFVSRSVCRSLAVPEEGVAQHRPQHRWKAEYRL